MNKTTKISLRVIALFAVAMFLSFIPEYIHSFLGDWQCEGSRYVYTTGAIYGQNEGCTYEPGSHVSTWHWGYRHWLWCTMCLILFVIQVYDIVHYSNKTDDK